MPTQRLASDFTLTLNLHASWWLPESVTEFDSDIALYSFHFANLATHFIDLRKIMEQMERGGRNRRMIVRLRYRGDHRDESSLGVTENMMAWSGDEWLAHVRNSLT